MKKILATALALCMVLSLAGCASGNGSSAGAGSSGTAGTASASTGTGSEDRTKIGVIIGNWGDQFQISVVQNMQNQAANYPDFEFFFEDAGNDSNTLFAELETMIQNGCEGMIVFPVDSTDGERILQICKEAGDIPCVGLSRTVENTDEFLCFVDSPHIDCGELCAEELLRVMGDTGKIAVLMGRPSSVGTLERTQGYHNILDEYPGIEFVAAEYAEFERNKAMEVVENWIQGGIEFDAILSNNDEMGLGAALVLEQNGMKDIPIIGVDGSEDGMHAVREGRLTATAFQDGASQGNVAMEMMVRVMNGEEFTDDFPAFQHVPYVILNENNINDDYYLHYFDNLG